MQYNYFLFNVMHKISIEYLTEITPALNCEEWLTLFLANQKALSASCRVSHKSEYTPHISAQNVV